MNYSIHFTETAARDLQQTADYIDHVLLNPSAADSLLAQLEEDLQHLKKFPQAYSIVDDPFLRAQRIRFIVVKKYLAFYMIDESNHIVHIIRFLYGKRDWIAVLKQGDSLY